MCTHAQVYVCVHAHMYSVDILLYILQLDHNSKYDIIQVTHIITSSTVVLKPQITDFTAVEWLKKPMEN